VTDDSFDKIFHTNSKSVAFALKHCLPAIEQSGGNGSIVVNSSIASRTVCAKALYYMLYAASKAANNMMVQYAVRLYSTCYNKCFYTHKRISLVYCQV
jgi:NAD(P)-dependent dehydrogenase (short-subunit alcohol dehydrogenase family)